VGSRSTALSGWAAGVSGSFGFAIGGAHAQVHLARRLTSLPATATAFQRGELSPQHASVIVRGVEAEEQA
jgi:hypothetical protein